MTGIFIIIKSFSVNKMVKSFEFKPVFQMSTLVRSFRMSYEISNTDGGGKHPVPCSLLKV
ncbi:MAG: hypothetical protein JO297_20705 [Nitrososphaeraceae archaeon]|nr:hypothetical protein [Nitrososphaeraceae archaeon]